MLNNSHEPCAEHFEVDCDVLLRMIRLAALSPMYPVCADGAKLSANEIIRGEVFFLFPAHIWPSSEPPRLADFAIYARR